MDASPRIGSLCSGYRGLDMAVEAVFGGTTAWVSDVDPGANKILAHHWPATPNISDLTTARWDDIEPVDILCGGYPCQPFSSAGLRKGTTDERHIWPYIADALRVLRPRVAIFENVAGHLRLGFDTVLADLARLGFDVEWALVRASEVGAPHRRERLFILARSADAAGAGWEGADAKRRRAAGDGGAATDAADLGHERGWDARGRWPGPADRGHAAAHADRGGLTQQPQCHSEPQPGQAAREHGLDAVGCGVQRGTASDTHSLGRGKAERNLREGQSDASWGRFLPAIRRWEAVTGRPAPRATDDRNRLSPAFVEWLMGLPAGHVTDVPGMARTQQLKALGNGVVPQQAAAAIRLLAARSTAHHQLAA